MTEQETSKISEVLSFFENKTAKETGVSMASGGFACADLDYADDDYFYITLQWGIQDGIENTVHTEEYKLALQHLDARPALEICMDIE